MDGKGIARISILWLAFAGLAAMSAYPPWLAKRVSARHERWAASKTPVDRLESGDRWYAAGYHSVWEPPSTFTTKTPSSGVLTFDVPARIDMERLGLQWLLALALAFAAWKTVDVISGRPGGAAQRVGNPETADEPPAAVARGQAGTQQKR